MSDLVISKMTEVGKIIRSVSVPSTGTWYVAKDIANVLGYIDQNQAIRINCENVDKLCDLLHRVGTVQKDDDCNSTFFNEIKDLTRDWHPTSLLIQRPDVHRLIVAAKRTKEEAAQFEKWIFDEVLEDVMDTGSYSLTNQNTNFQISAQDYYNLNQKNLELQERNLEIQSRITSLLEKMEERHDTVITHLMDSNTTLTNVVSKFNQTLADVRYQTAISTAFTIEDCIPLDRYIDIAREMVILDIRANFNDVNLRIYLNKNVGEKERIFKSNGEPYEKFIVGGHYRVSSGQTTTVYITKKGADYLYLFLKTKKIFE